MNLQDRITSEPGKMGGAPCVRGLRIPVATVLRCLSSGMTRDEIIGDYPELVSEDIDACLAFAAAFSKDMLIPLRPTGS